MPKIRVAFIKYGGLTNGGTECWLQATAAGLNKDAFEVTYFFTEKRVPERAEFLLSHGVRLIQVTAEGKKPPLGEWINTDLFEKFDENKYDIIQTAIAGKREWPFYLFYKPVVQRIAYDNGVDFSPNIHHSFHPSHWSREHWIGMGGIRHLSSVTVIGVEEPYDAPDMRATLGIPEGALVAGFHQRPDDNSFSLVPLNAFAELALKNTWFLILGGSTLYAEQAARLGVKNFRQLHHADDRKAVSSFLHTLDIFAHGRKDGETFGYVFLEALMHGLPCLGHAARANAHKDTMGPGGLWAKNEEEYAQRLKMLFVDPDLRCRLAVSGGRFAREMYNNERAIAHIESVYRKIHKKRFLYTTLIYCSIYIRNALYMPLNMYRELKMKLKQIAKDILWTN